jgi:hypothetical protein
MKTELKCGLSGVICKVAVLACSIASSALAATYYWDNNGTNAGFGTAGGTWAVPTAGNASSGWSTNSGGTFLPGNVTTTSADDLNFGTASLALGAGTITISAQQNPQVLNNGISDLVFGGVHKKRGFEETSTWLASGRLSGEELASATQNMEHRVKPEETAQWLEWLGDSGLPEEAARDRAYNLSAEWTEKDYQAAGKWLASAPDSPGKSAAVGAFAAKVHPYEPEIAMQWLETLPRGSDRSKALEAIHRGMQENKNYEKEAVEGFAREHGISK